MPADPSAFSTVLDGARCIVAAGSGGVGKTSTSAAIGMEAARRGKRTAVLTIDPARRLANALGLPEIGNEECEVDPEAFSRAGLSPPDGKLTAMMLDIKQAWDEVVHRYHPDAETRGKLLDNRLYETLSTVLAGSQEYMAMEKLYELTRRADDPLDVIVVDTPPAHHAMDFLEAPNRMFAALDNDATRWILDPYEQRKNLAGRAFERGSSFVVRQIARFTGTEILEDLAELLAGLSAMFDGFRERAKSVEQTLSSDATGFVVVSTPTAGGLADARDFVTRLTGRGVHVTGVVLNRATVDPFREAAPLRPAAVEARVLAAHGTVSLAERLRRNADEARRTARAEEAQIGRFRAAVPAALAVIPRFGADVHDLSTLENLRRALFEPG